MAERVKTDLNLNGVKKPDEISLKSQNRTPRLFSPANVYDHLLALQKTIGNRAVQELFRTGRIPPKLTTSRPHDAHEQEAERIAGRVMGIIEPVIQPEPKLQSRESMAALKQPQTDNIFPKIPTVSPLLESHLDFLPGGGLPLDSNTRTFFEDRFQYDFSGVRLHTEPPAAETARALHAKAYTIGHHIVFDQGQYAPETTHVKQLLAHELTHVVQQSDSTVSNPYPRSRLVQVRAPSTMVHRFEGGQWFQWHEEAKKKAPAPEPIPKAEAEPTPQHPQAVYEQKLREAAELITNANLEFGPTFRGWFGYGYFDGRLWERMKFKKKIVLKSGIDPSVAVDQIFAKIHLYRFDCAEAAQVSQWYALRHSYGATAFNNMIKSTGRNLELMQHKSTGIDMIIKYTRDSPSKPMSVFFQGIDNKIYSDKDELKSIDQLVDDAPIGSRVAWTNLTEPINSDWRNENSLKLGPDSFFAHDLGIKSRKDIETSLARHSGGPDPKQDPDGFQKYVLKNIFISEVEHYDTPDEQSMCRL